MTAWPVLFAPADAPEPPPVDPDGEPATWTFELEVDDEVVAVYQHASPGTGSIERYGIGEADVTWRPGSPDAPGTETDPDVLAALATGDGSLHTWDTRRVEMRWRRNGQTVWGPGPVVAHELDADAGTVKTIAWTREACVLQALILGMAERTNHLPEGDFDSTLSGWVKTDVAATAVTNIIYTGPYAARIAADTLDDQPAMWSTATFSTIGDRNYVDVAMVALLQAGAQLPLGTTAARVEHWTSDDGISWDPQSTEYLTYPDGYAPGNTSWHTWRERMPQFAGVQNRYFLFVYGATHDGWAGYGVPPAHIVGKAMVWRDDNASAPAGADYGSFLGAVLEKALEYLNGTTGMPDWARWSQPVYFPLTTPMRELLYDHADIRSLIDDAVRQGLATFWVPTGTRLLRSGPRRGRDHRKIVLTPETCTGLRAVIDGREAANVVGLLSDGQDAPTREEGYSRADAVEGFPLHRVVPAQPGTLPRDLDRMAERERETKGGQTITVEAAPAEGPARLLDDDRVVRDVPGAWAHVLEPGDRVPWALPMGPGGEIDPGRLGLVPVERIDLTPLSDTLALALDVVRPTA